MPLHPLWPGQWEEQQPSYDAFVKLSAAAGDPARPDRPEDDTESSPLSIDDILVDFPEDYVSLNYTGSPICQDNRRLSPDYPAGPFNIGVRSAHGYRESTAAERYAVHRVDDTIYDGQYIAIREPGPSCCRSQRPPPYTAPHIDRLDADLRTSLGATGLDRGPRFSVDRRPDPRVDTPLLYATGVEAQMALPPGAFHGPHSFPDAGNHLRIAVGIPLDLPVALESLLDPPAGARPTLPLRLLVGLAIYGSEQKSLTLQGIFDALAARFEYFREQDSAGQPSWRRSIRHALSLYSVFTKIERQEGDPGKGCYWTLNVNACANGPYDRPRKRNKRKGSGDISSDGASVSDWDESHLDPERASPAVLFETTNMSPRYSTIRPSRNVGSRSRALSPVGDATPIRTSRHRTRSRL